MKVNFGKVHIKSDECKVSLIIEIPKELINQEAQLLASDYAKRSQIDGFRKGKIPLEVVLNRYRTQIESEILTKYVEEGLKILEEFAETKDLQPLKTSIPPKLIEDSKEKIKLEIQKEYLPQIKLGKYKNIDLKPIILEVSEDEIVAEIEKLRKVHAILKPKDNPLKEGDVAVINVKSYQKESGQKIYDNVLMVEVGKDEVYKGFDQKIIGAIRGEKRIFFIDDLKFKVKIIEIKEVELAAVDDEFAKDLGCENLEKLKEDIAKQIESRKLNQLKQQRTEELCEKLLKIHKFNLPHSIINLELMNLLRFLNYKVQTLFFKNLDEFLKANKNLSKEKVIDALLPIAEKRTKIIYLLDKIGEKENIEIDEDGYREWLLRRVGGSQERFKKIFEDKAECEIFKSEYRLEKTIDFLLDKLCKIERR